MQVVCVQLTQKHFTNSFSFLLLILLSAISLFGCNSKALNKPTNFEQLLTPKGLITNKNRWLLDAYGRVLLFHGVNMVYKQPPYYPAADGFSSADAQLLSQHGFFIVRVGVLATGIMPSPGDIDLNYLNDVAKTVDLLAKFHIFSLIDFHQDGWGPSLGSDGFPEWLTVTNNATNTHTSFPLYYINNPAIQQAFQSFWDNAEASNSTHLLSDYAMMFYAIANEFKNNPYVIGYDLFNEPWPGINWSSCLSSCKNLDQDELNKAYLYAARAIRKAGSKQLIFAEPFVTFNFGGETTYISPPLNSQQSGMSFHVYPFPGNIQAELTAAQATVQHAISWSNLTHGALLNTEWGATGDVLLLDGESSILNKNLIPWIYWSFDGEIVKDVHLPPTGTNLVTTTLQALTQPYPLAIAGTPISFNFNPTTNSLKITYKTINPQNKKLGSSIPSLIEVPASAYPNGFTVKLFNARLPLGCHSGIIPIQADPNALIVNVSISAGGNCH